MEIFAKLAGFHLTFAEDRPHQTTSKWSVKQLKIGRAESARYVRAVPGGGVGSVCLQERGPLILHVPSLPTLQPQEIVLSHGRELRPQPLAFLLTECCLSGFKLTRVFSGLAHIRFHIRLPAASTITESL